MRPTRTRPVRGTGGSSLTTGTSSPRARNHTPTPRRRPRRRSSGFDSRPAKRSLSSSRTPPSRSTKPIPASGAGGSSTRRNVLADSGEEHVPRRAAEAMMTLKEQAPNAELLEIETAAFELFVDEDDEWGWRLIDEAGKLVAEDPSTHPTRGAARQAMNRLLEYISTPTCGRWIGRSSRRTRRKTGTGGSSCRPVTPSPSTARDHPTRDELVDGLDDVRDAAATARRSTVGDVSVQLLYGNGEWHFRLLDRDRAEIADSTVSYPDREAATDGVDALTAHAPDAPIFADRGRRDSPRRRRRLVVGNSSTAIARCSPRRSTPLRAGRTAGRDRGGSSARADGRPRRLRRRLVRTRRR